MRLIYVSYDTNQPKRIDVTINKAKEKGYTAIHLQIKFNEINSVNKSPLLEIAHENSIKKILMHCPSEWKNDQRNVEKIKSKILEIISIFKPSILVGSLNKEIIGNLNLIARDYQGEIIDSDDESFSRFLSATDLNQKLNKEFPKEELHLVDVSKLTHKIDDAVKILFLDEFSPRISIKEEPVLIHIQISGQDYLEITLDALYENIKRQVSNKAIAVIEYYDADHQLIDLPYAGFTKSSNNFWYVYLAGSKNTVKLLPPVESSYALLKLTGFFLSGKEDVSISSRLDLRWLNNEGQNLRETRRPFLPLLSFESGSYVAPSSLKVASILDEFSYECFKYECDLIAITPKCWRSELLDHHVDMVLVESAWHGNNNAWQYRIGKYAKPPDNELSKLINWAKSKKIPTVFWNKEDPPNFEHFIDRAIEFDYIFTTDENCVEKYKERVGPNAKVFSLPFAAQPSIHNAFLKKRRENGISFAGSYYADDFHERKKFMEQLLFASAKYPLDIYDRMHDLTGKDKERFTFPKELQNYIRGKLNYGDVIESYKWHRLGLNVNSVSDSPTMFARRVFEMLSCGTPVISTPSIGVDNYFKGIVPTPALTVDVSEEIHRLMTDPLYWLQKSVLGMRAIHSGNTYAHRLETVAKTAGLRYQRSIPKLICIILPFGDGKSIADEIKQQSFQPSEILIPKLSPNNEQAENFLHACKALGIKAINMPLENIISYLLDIKADHLVSICNPNDHYGKNYFLDAVNILSGDGEVIGSLIPEVDYQSISNGKCEFDDVSGIGMPINRGRLSSLIFRPNRYLLDNFMDSFSQPFIELTDCKIQSRAWFGFLPTENRYKNININQVFL